MEVYSLSLNLIYNLKLIKGNYIIKNKKLSRINLSVNNFSNDHSHYFS